MTIVTPDAEAACWVAYGWLAERPPVLFQSMGRYDFNAHLPPGRVYRLCSIPWAYSLVNLVRDYHRDREARPMDVQYILPNDAEDHRQLRACGVPSVFVNQNALLDESILRVLPDAPRSYDAVYVARMDPVKRHVLARRVPRLLMIGGNLFGLADPTYFPGVRRALPQAHFTLGDPRYMIHAATLARWLNRARVGLCLSAVEGAMYASAEYLLCGLPVVSTYNKGGRNEFLDPRYCRIVPDDPQAIAEAVQELVALRLPPEWIREQTLLRMAEHRRRLVDLVQTCYDLEQVKRSYAADFDSTFFNKLCVWRAGRDVMTLQATDCAPKRKTPARLAINLLEPGSPLRPVEPSVVTLAVGGPRSADLWRALLIALDVRRQVPLRVRLNARWQGAAAEGPESVVDHADLARALLAVLGSDSAIDIVSEPPEPEATAIDWSDYLDRPMPTPRTLRRWSGWGHGLLRRITYDGGGQDRWDGQAGTELGPVLHSGAPDFEAIGLDERRPAACVAQLAASDLFVGGAGGLTQLAYAVGVPVFLLGVEPATRWVQPAHGDRPAIWCGSAADLIRKVQWFLGRS